MTVRLPIPARNALLSTIANQVDSGTGAGQLRVYSGTQPATADLAPTGTLLLTFTLAKPAFATPANGKMSLAIVPPVVAEATAAGTAGWARLVNSSGITVMDGSVGLANADFVISTTNLIVGHSVVLSAILTMA